MTGHTQNMTFFIKPTRWRLMALAAGILLIFIPFVLRKNSKMADQVAYTARRGPLNITVMEGGSLQALESQEIKCEVRVGGQGAKILRIVEEGTLLNDKDVQAGKLLVELDSSEIENQLVQQEIQFQSASASYIDAQENYEIQLNQNMSDITAGEQKVRFARMDFDRYLGYDLAVSLVAEYALDKSLPILNSKTVLREDARKMPLSDESISLESNGKSHSISRSLEDSSTDNSILNLLQTNHFLSASTTVEKVQLPLESETVTKPAIDFSKYAHIEILGAGEAKQHLRKLQDDLQVAQKECKQSENTLNGTRRLFKEQFVTQNDLERDELAHTSVLLKVQTAETARDLFQRYEFTKQAEEYMTKYSEAVRELERTRKAAVSKLAQADARLKSAEAQHNVQLRRRNDLQEQIKKCVIKATQPGLVIYGDPNNEDRSSQDRIRVGTTAREYQTIITIPNLLHMGVSVKIHESYIKKVQLGQKARVIVDAFPDKVMEAQVTKVSVLPDSQDRWMNPDLKVYLTSLTIDGSYDWLKPGMTAKVEIFVDHIENALQIPVQSVRFDGGTYICQVLNGINIEKRSLKIGQFNDEFIEILSGLKDGEKVLLSPHSSPLNPVASVTGTAPAKIQTAV